MQKYQDDLADLPDNKGGLQSTLYSLLTIALVSAGAAYLLAPEVMLTYIAVASNCGLCK